MRKEYAMTLSNFVQEFFNHIDDFFSNFTSLYTLIDSRTDRRVYHNNEFNLDLIFYNVDTKHQISQKKIILVVTTAYDSSEEIWYQKDIICSGKSDVKTDYSQFKDFYVKNAAYYFPAPTIKEGEKLVCNYHSENNTFMFSVLRNCVFDYTYTTSTVWRTENLFFGGVTKYLSFNGGFFYGGDFVNTYERYFREDNSGNPVDEGLVCIYDDKHTDIEWHLQPPPINFVNNFWGQPWANNPYQQFDCACRNKEKFPEPNNVNRFDAIMRLDIDNAPNRRKNDEVDISDVITNSTYNIKKIIRNQIWAVTMELDYYVPMVCSITSSTKPLPRYEPLLSVDFIDSGRTVNTLNNISTIMPLWFMVRRDPEFLDNFSGAGKNDVINFVNMFNMASNRIENGTFPTKEHYVYNCFQMGNRRSMYGMKGYSGIAFRQDTGELPPPPEPDPPEPPTSLELLDLEEMERHISPMEDEPLLNIEVDGKKGYGGDTFFTDMTNGSFILKHPYTDYSSLTFEFCNDEGTDTDTVTWSKEDLDAALNGSTDFNLLDGSSLISVGEQAIWAIEPFSEGSTSTTFICNYQNCGLIGAKGNV